MILNVNQLKYAHPELTLYKAPEDLLYEEPEIINLKHVTKAAKGMKSQFILARYMRKFHPLEDAFVSKQDKLSSHIFLPFCSNNVNQQKRKRKHLLSLK